MGLIQVSNVREDSDDIQAEFEVLAAYILSSEGQVAQVSLKKMTLSKVCNGEHSVQGEPLKVHLEEGDFLVVIARGEVAKEKKLNMFRLMLFRADGASVRLMTAYYGSTRDEQGWDAWRFPMLHDVLMLHAEMMGEEAPILFGQVNHEKREDRNIQ